jgi:hypothetical protein
LILPVLFRLVLSRYYPVVTVNEPKRENGSKKDIRSHLIKITRTQAAAMSGVRQIELLFACGFTTSEASGSIVYKDKRGTSYTTLSDFSQRKV